MRFITKTLTVLALSLAVAKTHAVETFVVEDIQVEGLQRVELGTFFTALPIRVGETLDDARVPNVIRALYKTGNFDFVKLEKEGNILKISVAERPVISRISIVGNKVLKTEQIMSGLEYSGVVEKEPLNQFVLDKIKQEITSQYFSNGQYEVDIETKLVELSRNRVNLNVIVKEGGRSLIRNINIIGNDIFGDEELLGQLESTSGDLFSWITNDNKYSKEQLDDDIETLESYYRDRGYLDFKVISSAISLSDDLKEIYIGLKVQEGEKYRVSDVKLVGDLKIDSESILALIPVESGDYYSEAVTKFYQEQIQEYLGFFGYTYAQVRTIPEKSEDTNEVALTVAINPGERYYLNNIVFLGSSDTDENVFRRELRLKEGEPVSSKLIERSKLRLQRIPFIEDVKITNKKSETSEDKLDLIYEIKERGAAQISGSLGYNERFGLSLQGNISHNNFLGEGKNVGLGISINKAQKSINMSYSEPYFFKDGAGLSASLSYNETDYEKLNIFTGQSLDTLGLNLGLFYPLGEFSGINYGLSYQDNTLKAPGSFDLRVLEFFESFNQDLLTEPELDFTNLAFNIGWNYNQLNKSLFPTRGFSHSLGLEVGTPIGDTEYYKANYNYKHYIPISDSSDWIFSFRANLGYGAGLGDTERLPYFKNFYSSGATGLRGFEQNTIGPRNINIFPSTTTVPPPFPGSGTGNIGLPSEIGSVTVGNYSVGGDSLATATIELIFPPMLTDNKNVRTSFFVDAGNIWDSKFNVNRFDGLDIINNRSSTLFESVPDFSEASNYRVSAGISIQWWSPLGPLSFSFAQPIKSDFYDDTKTFTFSIGQTF